MLEIPQRLFLGVSLTQSRTDTKSLSHARALSLSISRGQLRGEGWVRLRGPPRLPTPVILRKGSNSVPTRAHLS